MNGLLLLRARGRAHATSKLRGDKVPLRIYREVGVHRRDLGVRLRVRLRRSKT